MRKRGIDRLLVLALSIILTVAALPAAVKADGEAAQTGAPVTLLKDDGLTVTMTVDPDKIVYDGETGWQNYLVVTDALGTDVTNIDSCSITLADERGEWVESAVNAGTYKATASFRGMEAQTSFTVLRYPIANCTVSGGKDLVFTGYQVDPGLVITSPWGAILTEEIDYAVGLPKDMMNAGRKSGLINGVGNYIGTKPVTVDIAPETFESVTFALSPEIFPFLPGMVCEPAVTGILNADSDQPYTLVQGKDYQVKYVKNDGVGAAEAVIASSGINFKKDQTVTLPFKIEPAVARVGETLYTSLQKAADNVKPGETVELTADVKLKEPVGFSCKDVTLDLAGFAITGMAGQVNILKVEGGSLILADSSLSGKGAIIMSEEAPRSAAAVVVSDGAALRVTGGQISGGTYGIKALDGAQVTVEGPEDSEVPEPAIEARTTALNAVNAKIIVTGGRFRGNNGAGEDLAVPEGTEIFEIPSGEYEGWYALYKEASYTWADDYKTVTAEKTSASGRYPALKETAETTADVKKPTCTEWGEITYTAVFKSEAFETKTEVVKDGEPLGHAWGEWTVTKEPTVREDGEETRICGNDAAHVEHRIIPRLKTGWRRVAGSNRFKTMEAVTKQGFPDGKCAKLIVTTGRNYADALAAAGLAGMWDCPVITTEPDTFKEATKNEISRLSDSGTQIYILGDTAAVSAKVEKAVNAYGNKKAKRIKGKNRIATAVEIYKTGEAWSDTCFLTYGFNFADALAISPYAYASKSPIFLTDKKGGIPEAEKACFNDFDKVIILGSTSAVGEEAENELKSAGKTVMRLAGPNRYATGAEIIKWESGLSDGVIAPAVTMDLVTMVVANGEDYPDALMSVNLAGRQHMAMLLAADKSKATKYIDAIIKPNCGGGAILGSTSAVSAAVEKKLNQAIE